MSRAALEAMIQEEVAPFLSRFTLSNLKSQQIVQALIGLPAPVRARWSLPERVRFARKPYFDDALPALRDPRARPPGEGHEALAEWQRRGPPPAPAQGRRRERTARGAPAGRRRRRRRRGPSL